MPESNRPGSDPETLRSKAPQHVPVLVQHAIATTMWGDFIFVFAVRNTQSDCYKQSLIAGVLVLCVCVYVSLSLSLSVLLSL